MKWKASIPLALMALLAVANAEDLPSQPLSPSQSTGEVEEPALPASESSPPDPEPGLLPKSGELPARPAPAKLSSTPAPRRQALEKEGRFEAVRSLAMDNQRAISLLRRARQSSSSISRRTYLRAYYLTVASRMRRLDPAMKSSINAYEEAKLHELSGTGSSTSRASSHRARLHRTVGLNEHRRLHRVSFENRHRRFIIIDAPYGPEFPPYGPPEVFEPW
jgi:hypothetical protein